ncbi:uncharacterized protein LOC106654530 [Trichogramma pretiosum]|uniref:uncharacterized protein LOC106654530 n=1 Tax=Trichogramma pretiosum TaxID=7493 RepID=UPI000C71C978|nr:uncharacterized protein LOC106654530 [Trichogramma pretiosum]
MVKMKNYVGKHFKLIQRPANQKLDSYQCNYCPKIYVQHTTRMADHLLECQGCPSTVKNTVQNHSKTAKKRKLNEEENNAQLDEDIDDDEVHCASSHDNNKQTKDGRRNLKSFLDKISKYEQESCEELLAKAIITGGVSFRFLENEYFLEFLNKLRPTFKPPKRAELSDTLLEKIYQEVKGKVKAKIDAATTLTVQSDSYTNINKEGIINFVVNTPEPVFYKSVETKAESQTAQHLTDQICSVVEEINPNKTIAVVTDNAAYCRKAWELVEQRYAHNPIFGYGCAAHGFNLLCHDILNEVSAKDIMRDSVKIVKAIKQSNILTAALKNVRELDENERVLSLKLPVKTRWGSSLDCLTSLNVNRSCLQKLSISTHAPRLPRDVKNLILDSDDNYWWKVRSLISLLQPVVVYLKKIEGNESCIHNVCDFFNELKQSINQVLLYTTPSIMNFDEAQSVLKNLDERVKFILNPAHYAASILNPASKGKTLSAENYTKGYELIVKTANKFDGIDKNKLLIQLAQYTTESDFWATEHVQKSVALVSAVDWWKGPCSCTVVSRVAVAILNLPCSSAATERTFSAYGWIHNAKRNRFTAARASKVTYIAHNLKLLNPKKKKDICELESEEEDDEEIEIDDYVMDENDQSVRNLSSVLQNEDYVQEGEYIIDEDGSLVPKKN